MIARLNVDPGLAFIAGVSAGIWVGVLVLLITWLVVRQDGRGGAPS